MKATPHLRSSASRERDHATVHDPSTSSYYVNEQLYQELVTSFADWQRDELAIHDLAERDQLRMLVEKEARLLDQLAFDEWLGDVTRPNASTGCRERRPQETRGAKSPFLSMTVGAWRTGSTACAPATPGRKRRNPAPSA